MTTVKMQNQSSFPGEDPGTSVRQAPYFTSPSYQAARSAFIIFRASGLR